MITHFKQIRLKLEQSLETINKEEHDKLFAAKKSLVLIRDCCRQLSTLRVQCDFKTKEDEIYFFKELKCYYYSLLYYNQDIIEIHAGLPNGSQDLKVNFLKECLNKLHDHFINNKFLYTYYRIGSNENDHQYFSVIPKHDTKFDDQGRRMFCEDEFSCTYDYLFSRVISNDKLEKYLHREIMKLEETEMQPQVTAMLQRSKLEWTESKAALVELLYALYTSNCINNGKVDIKELVSSAKYIFPNMEISDHYRIFIK